jgi:hypothetical protein
MYEAFDRIAKKKNVNCVHYDHEYCLLSPQYALQEVIFIICLNLQLIP